MGVKFLLVTVLTICTSYFVTCEKNIVCYYGTWATYRWGNGKFDVGDVNPDLCTHLIYAFVGIDGQGNVISLDSYLDLPDNYGRDNFGKFNALKQQNPNLKTLLAVGGWNEGSGKYSIMVADANLRKNFITSALHMVLSHGFDGFDLDWEYPNRRDTVHGQADIDNFTKLVKELKEEFQKYGLQVTAAVASVRDMAVLSYDVSAICQYLDIVNLMTYDYYGAWDAVTGHNAGLHRGEGDENTPRESLYTVDVAVEYWLEQGCPADKLAIGLPFYGRSFKLTDANVNGVKAPANGAGIAGPCTATAGNLGYNELCNILQSESGWEVKYDELAEVPYAVNGNNWVSYDDAHSLTKKIEWGLERNISSLMIWSIETDDFNGVCGEDYPLLRAMNRALGKNIGGTTTTTKATSITTEAPNEPSTTKASTTEATSPEKPSTGEPVTETITTISAPTTNAVSTTSVTTEAPGDLNSACVAEGILPNPYNCSQFLMCIRTAKGTLHAVLFHCPNNTQFDASIMACNYADSVKCGL